MKHHTFQTVCILAIFSALAFAQDVTSFEKRVTVKKLPNGLTLMVCERPEAPVFSFFTLVDAGSAQDPMLATGLAHMFEHMAFKGTDKIGTTNYPAEKAALEKVEVRPTQPISPNATRQSDEDAAKLQQLEKNWKDAIAAGDKFVTPNEFGKIVEQNGGEDMNAFTSFDETGYHYSMPENRLELWAYLESERFLHPVTREFYKERKQLSPFFFVAAPASFSVLCYHRTASPLRRIGELMRQLLVIDRSNDDARAQLTRVEDSRRNTIGVVRDESGTD